MADRYEDRYRAGDRSRYEREDRGFINRAGDEVRSWFGDAEADRRRRVDERERERERRYQRDYGPGMDYEREPTRERGYAHPGERGFGTEQWGGERSTVDYGRSEFGRTTPGSYGAGYRSETGWGARSGAYGERYPGVYGAREAGWETTRRGDFTGRGPKGYQRSDTRINEDVCDRLADAPDLDASNIEVKVKDGEVTLSGTVSHREDKRRAEDLIEDLSGVREVHNQLHITRWQEGTPSVTTATGETTRR